MDTATLDLRSRALDHEIPGAINFRDLGGVPTQSGATVRTGLLFRSAMTHHLGDAGMGVLRGRFGIRTVIDFRGDHELESDGVAAFADHDIAFRHIPIVASTALTPDQQRDRFAAMRNLTHDWAASYQHIVTEKPGAFIEFFEILADADSLPAVFHCAGGRDRTGIAAALVLGVLDVSHAIIAHDYALTGEYLEPHVGHFSRHMEMMDFTSEEFGLMLATRPEPMERFLAWIVASHGSVAKFVETLGVPASQLGRVRDRLLA